MYFFADDLRERLPRYAEYRAEREAEYQAEMMAEMQQLFDEAE